MTKPYIGCVIFPASHLETMQNYAMQLGDGGEAEKLNFSIKFCLVSAPTVVVAYGGMTGPISEATVDYIEKNVLPTMPFGSFWMRCANETFPYRVLKTNYVPTQALINDGQTVLFDRNRILAAVGMIEYVLRTP